MNKRKCACCNRETCPNPPNDEDEASSQKSSNAEYSDKETQKTPSEHSQGASEYRNASIDMKGVYNSMEDPKLFRGCLLRMAIVTQDLVSVLRGSKSPRRRENSQQKIIEQDLYFGPLNFEIPIEICVEDDENTEMQEYQIKEMNIGSKNIKFDDMTQSNTLNYVDIKDPYKDTQFLDIEDVPNTLEEESLKKKEIFYSCESLPPNDQNDFADNVKENASNAIVPCTCQKTVSLQQLPQKPSSSFQPDVAENLMASSSLDNVAQKSHDFKKAVLVEQVDEKSTYSKSNESTPNQYSNFTESLDSVASSNKPTCTCTKLKSATQKSSECMPSAEAKYMESVASVESTKNKHPNTSKPPGSKSSESSESVPSDQAKKMESTNSVENTKKKPCTCKHPNTSKPPGSKSSESSEYVPSDQAKKMESVASVESTKKKPCTCKHPNTSKPPGSKSRESSEYVPSDQAKKMESVASVESTKKKPCSCKHPNTSKLPSSKSSESSEYVPSDQAKKMESVASVESTKKKPCTCKHPNTSKLPSSKSGESSESVTSDQAKNMKNVASVESTKKKPCTCKHLHSSQPPGSESLESVQSAQTRNAESLASITSTERKPCTCKGSKFAKQLSGKPDSSKSSESMHSDLVCNAESSASVASSNKPTCPYGVPSDQANIACPCKKSKSAEDLLTKLPHSSRGSVIKCKCAQRKKSDVCECGREKVEIEDLQNCNWAYKQAICDNEKCACDIAQNIIDKSQQKDYVRKEPVLYRLAFPQHKEIEVCIKCRYEPSPLLDENEQVFCPGNCGCCLCAWKPRATRSLEDVLMHQKVKVCKCRHRGTIFTDFAKVGSACSQVSYFDLCPCREKAEAKYLELYGTEMWDKNERLKNLKNDERIYLADVREIAPATKGAKARFLLSRMYKES